MQTAGDGHGNHKESSSGSAESQGSLPVGFLYIYLADYTSA